MRPSPRTSTTASSDASFSRRYAPVFLTFSPKPSSTRGGQRRVCGRHGEIAAAERRSMVTWREGRGNLGTRRAGAHGKARGNALRHGDDIGDDAEVLKSERLPRAEDAALNLIADEQGARRARQLPGGGEKLLRAGMNSRLALNALHHNRADLAVATSKSSSRAETSFAGVAANPPRERLKRLLLRRLRRRRERCKRTPVEALLERDDQAGRIGYIAPELLGALSCEKPRELYGALVSLRPELAKNVFHGMRSEGSTLSFNRSERM